MSDLFDWQNKYPYVPGAKVNGTSKDAATSMKPQLTVLWKAS